MANSTMAEAANHRLTASPKRPMTSIPVRTCVAIARCAAATTAHGTYLISSLITLSLSLSLGLHTACTIGNIVAAKAVERFS